ncbi:hypothetical protein [Microseira sp. BLCC-F43]|jgi:hypothetical protein|uniref:hypothetical protein n=1 Tax=Microseira sp. BLCC-F43 TaxID=3153602 RepID=UPI0035B94F5D
MDIKKPVPKTTTSLESTKEQVKFKAGVVQTADAKILIPPAIQSKLTALGSKYGVPFDLANIALDGKMAENVKAIRKIADMVTADSKLLPEMLRQIRRLMRAPNQAGTVPQAVNQSSYSTRRKAGQRNGRNISGNGGLQVENN